MMDQIIGMCQVDEVNLIKNESRLVIFTNDHITI